MANIIMCRFDKVIQRLRIEDAIFTILIANQKKSGDKKRDEHCIGCLEICMY